MEIVVFDHSRTDLTAFYFPSLRTLYVSDTLTDEQIKQYQREAVEYGSIV